MSKIDAKSYLNYLNSAVGWEYINMPNSHLNYALCLSLSNSTECNL